MSSCKEEIASFIEHNPNILRGVTLLDFDDIPRVSWAITMVPSGLDKVKKTLEARGWIQTAIQQWDEDVDHVLEEKIDNSLFDYGPHIVLTYGGLRVNLTVNMKVMDDYAFGDEEHHPFTLTDVEQELVGEFDCSEDIIHCNSDGMRTSDGVFHEGDNSYVRIQRGSLTWKGVWVGRV